jgi:hypothetical protein
VRLSPAEQQELSAAAQHVSDIDESLVQTRFIAETLLPTKYGKFRLRGYKHSVSSMLELDWRSSWTAALLVADAERVDGCRQMVE